MIKTLDGTDKEIERMANTVHKIYKKINNQRDIYTIRKQNSVEQSKENKYIKKCIYIYKNKKNYEL